MEDVESPSNLMPPAVSMATVPMKKTKMDKLKKLTPVSLKKSPKQEKRQNHDQIDDTANDIPLHEAIEDAKKALDLFLNNEFEVITNSDEPPGVSGTTCLTKHRFSLFPPFLPLHHLDSLGTCSHCAYLLAA